MARGGGVRSCLSAETLLSMSSQSVHSGNVSTRDCARRRRVRMSGVRLSKEGDKAREPVCNLGGKVNFSGVRPFSAVGPTHQRSARYRRACREEMSPYSASRRYVNQKYLGGTSGGVHADRR